MRNKPLNETQFEAVKETFKSLGLPEPKGKPGVVQAWAIAVQYRNQLDLSKGDIEHAIEYALTYPVEWIRHDQPSWDNVLGQVD